MSRPYLTKTKVRFWPWVNFCSLLPPLVFTEKHSSIIIYNCDALKYIDNSNITCNIISQPLKKKKKLNGETNIR